LPTYTSDTIGGLDDRVVMRLFPPTTVTTNQQTLWSTVNNEEVATSRGGTTITGGSVEVQIAEAWDWTSSIMEQPSHFSIQVGSSQTAGEILRSFPKGCKVGLYINDCLQATGRVDGREAQGDAENGMIVTIHGRDVLSKAVMAHVEAVQTFKNTTYTQLVWRVLRHLNLVQGGVAYDPSQLAVSNDANRQIRYGNKVKPIVVTGQPLSPNQIVSATDEGPLQVTALVQSEIQCNVGESWMAFLRRYLDPAGLSLWAAADGTFVLSAPNAQQQPAYQIVKRKQSDRTLGNVKWTHLVDDATHQHTFAKCFGKGFGRKAGRVTATGTAPNEELLNPINDPTWFQENPDGFGAIAVTFRERNCFTNEQCENFAWRRMAEERRNGFQLHYRVAGHTLPLFGMTSAQAVIVEDTVVAVDDEELGIKGNFYIDTVHRQRHPQTETIIRLCRPSDIITSSPITASPVTTPSTTGTVAGFGSPSSVPTKSSVQADLDTIAGVSSGSSS
jgi:prophage tail gpP-like protein